mmetsp:Transcript_9611/g.12165  ORF Transcript_9611/g.12165 Transcript_9611/m.12165 type:complete len:97 (-) Transcript_9611:145-435(-)
MAAITQAPEQIPVDSRNRQMRSKMYVSGLDKKAIGNADATSCHDIDPRMVVIMAPSIPVSKRAWAPSETPKIFGSSPSSFTLVTLATKNMHDTTHN